MNFLFVNNRSCREACSMDICKGNSIPSLINQNSEKVNCYCYKGDIIKLDNPQEMDMSPCNGVNTRKMQIYNHIK
jgi:hypothetical protein